MSRRYLENAITILLTPEKQWVIYKFSEEARKALSMDTEELYERLFDSDEENEIDIIREPGFQIFDVECFTEELNFGNKPFTRGSFQEIRQINPQKIYLPDDLIKPIDCIIHCQFCGRQHVDKPEPETGWTNPVHTSHLCHYCNKVFRPSDYPTNGVKFITTIGEKDNRDNRPYIGDEIGKNIIKILGDHGKQSAVFINEEYEHRFHKRLSTGSMFVAFENLIDNCLITVFETYADSDADRQGRPSKSYALTAGGILCFERLINLEKKN